MAFKINDKVLVEDKYKCKITNIFDYDGEEWVEVMPIWEGAVNFAREVPASVIKLLEEN